MVPQSYNVLIITMNISSKYMIITLAQIVYKLSFINTNDTSYQYEFSRILFTQIVMIIININDHIYGFFQFLN